jgi:hypothetical protein
MQPGLVLGAYVETLPVEEGIGSAARSILGRGPAQPRLPRSRKASGTDRHDARRGSRSWTSREAIAARSVGLRRRQERAGLGAVGGRSGGTVTDPKRIDDWSVIGSAGDGRGTGRGYGKIKSHLTSRATARGLGRSREARPLRGTSWLPSRLAARRAAPGVQPDVRPGCRRRAAGVRTPCGDPCVRAARESLRKRAARTVPAMTASPTGHQTRRESGGEHPDCRAPIPLRIPGS